MIGIVDFIISLLCSDEDAQLCRGSVRLQSVVSEEGSRLTNASTLSDTVLPSTPEGPGEMFVSPLGSVARKASPRLSGVSRLMKTPRQKQRHSVDLSGLKSLVKTPKTVRSPELSGIKQLMKTPKAQRSLSLGSAMKLTRTSEDVSGTPELDGIRKLMKTPKPRKSVALDGIEQLMKTPKAQKSLASGSGKKRIGAKKDVLGTPELDGVRQLMKTPKPRKSVALDGVRQLMKSPKVQKSPALDGVRNLVTTPKDSARTPKLGDIRALVKTPKSQKSPRLSGVKKLLRTPKPQKSPQVAGLKAMLKTPKQQQSPALEGVGQLMKTPKAVPKTPDFVGISEMLASPQSDGFMDSVRQKSVPKKKSAKKVSSPASRVLTPKAPGTRAKKVLEKTTETQLAMDVSLSRRKKGASSSQLDDDEVVVSKRLKMGKSSTETTPRKPRSGGKKVSESTSALSPVSSKGRSRSRRQVVEETEVLVSKASSTPVAKSRNKVSKSGPSEVVSSISKATVKSHAKSAKVSKKAADLPTVPGLDKTAVIRLDAFDITAAKKNARHITVVSPVSGPSGLSRGGRVSKPRTANVVGDSVKHALQDGGKKSRSARNQKAALVVDLTESEEDNEVEVRVVSKKKKGAASVSSKTKAKASVRTTKGKKSPVDPTADKPIAALKGKLAASKQLASAPSKNLLDDHSSGGSAHSPVSTRGGKRQVIVSEKPLPVVENVKTHGKDKKSSTAAGGRRGRQQLLQEEALDAIEDNTVKSLSVGQVDQKTATGSKKPVQIGKRAAGKQIESTSSSSVPAKSPVSTRRGRRQVVAEETVPVAEMAKGQKKGKEQPAAARVAGGRRGKPDEPQPAVDSSSSIKTPARTRKRAQASDAVHDAPLHKQQRAEEAPVAEQPVKKATKQRGGKSSEAAEPLLQPTKPQRKTGAKKQSKSMAKKAGKKLEPKQKVVDNLPSYNQKQKKDETVLVEKNKIAVVSPPATRSKRTRH